MKRVELIGECFAKREHVDGLAFEHRLDVPSGFDGARAARR